jgi:hypothetical protein
LKFCRAPKVFVSYSHELEETGRNALGLATRLRSQGIEATIDRYNFLSNDDLPKWMEDQIQGADYVLVVCDSSYRNRFDLNDPVAQGVPWEARLIRNLLYAAQGRSSKFLPITFRSSDADSVPLALKGAKRFDLVDEKGYEDLYRTLTGQPETPPGEIGTIRLMAPQAPVDLALPQEFRRHGNPVADLPLIREENARDLAIEKTNEAFSTGKELLVSGAYGNASKKLRECIDTVAEMLPTERGALRLQNLKEMAAEARYYLVLCNIAGKRPANFSQAVIDKLEQHLQAAMSIYPKGHYSILWAFIKFDYYVLNRFSEPQPRHDELVRSAQPSLEMSQHAGLLTTHVQAPGNHVWDWLKSWSLSS